ncbi:DUF2945 domain-containing protein [Actinomadura craniellae]|uniref:DUF2945 domain-containing protein n=1 Tax=Actinomadura craniellae TaxID=2231787 RepID=A0A365H2W3_9ACTN|nr:DUF2945 domain-containing protein [Actinomadura craniellae]RAY13368.1 DUF2945 domain-containing protein [Actinomadura craniellae]
MTKRRKGREGDDALAPGDEVTWRSHGTEVPGTVEEEITGRTEAAGREVAASEEDPQYRVRSGKSGKEAVHRPSALRKRS